MAAKPIGAVEILQGTLDEVRCNIFCMTEPDCVSSIMSTCGSNTEVMDHPTTSRSIQNGVSVRHTFYYTSPFSYHYRYRNAVDDHNHRRQGRSSIEEGYNSNDWAKRIFSFIIGVCVVNAYRMKEYLNTGNWRMIQLDFQRSLAVQLLKNKFDDGAPQRPLPENSPEPEVTSHTLVTKPPYTGRWLGNEWFQSSCKYLQSECSGCRKPTRQYCSCDRTRCYCVACFVEHRKQV